MTEVARSAVGYTRKVPERLKLENPGPRALIHVADPDLASALETGLMACGAKPEICERLADITGVSLSDRSLLVVDLDLIPGRVRQYLAGLRAAGWHGLAVLLAEDCTVSEAAFDRSENVVVLRKPFGGPELRDTVRRAREG